VQFDIDIAKINFAMTYLTGVAQDWFEVGLNQEDQDIFQDWLQLEPICEQIMLTF